MSVKRRRWLSVLNAIGIATALIQLLAAPVSAASRPAVVYLPPLSGWAESDSVALNDRATVVGISYVRPNDVRATRWDSLGHPLDLGALSDSPYSRPTAINAHDEVVGFAYSESGPDRPLRWDAAGRLVELDTDGWASGRAVALNDHGDSSR